MSEVNCGHNRILYQCTVKTAKVSRIYMQSIGALFVDSFVLAQAVSHPLTVIPHPLNLVLQSLAVVYNPLAHVPYPLSDVE